MAQSQIESQPQPGDLVLRHTPVRTVVFVAIMLAQTMLMGCQVVWHPTWPWWVAACDVLGVATASYLGLVVAVRFIRGIPLLQASEAGITINNTSGRLFVRWPDIEDFSADDNDIFGSIGIRLREGARPIGSTWTRIMSAYPCKRRTIVVGGFITVARPTQIAEALASLRSRYLPLERGVWRA
jgi:hypothetical protein